MQIVDDPDKRPQPETNIPQQRFYLTGLALVISGVLYLLDRSGTIITPIRFLSWEFLLIIAGIYIGEKHNFKNLSWLVCIGIGLYFILDDFYPHFDLRFYFGPLLLIALGAYFLFSPRAFKGRTRKARFNHSNSYEKGFASDNAGSDDYIDIVSIFGGVNKNVMSKQLKGGEATSIFGGTELNLMQADFQGKVILELTQVFGGCTLIVPPNWDVKTEIVSIFGGVEDNRPTQNIIPDPHKVLLIKGTSIFGGIEIKSY